MGKKYVAYVGTYTHGTSKGIQVYDVNLEEGTLTERSEVEVSNASYTAVSKNGKYLLVMADHGNQIAMFTVGAGDLRVIPGKPDLGHEVYYRRNSANYLHVRFPTAKCRQQLPGSAVKSHITGKSDHNLLIFRMIPYIIRDHIAAVFIYHCLSRLPNGICHPLCANNQIRAFRRFFP